MQHGRPGSISPLDEYDVLEYVEGKISPPLENASQAIKFTYKKGEIKAMKITIDSLRDHLLVYISSLKTSKEMHDKIVGRYDVNNLSHIMELKNQLKESKLHQGETVQSFFIRITEIRDQLQTAQEIILDRELVMTALISFLLHGTCSLLLSRTGKGSLLLMRYLLYAIKRKD